MKNKRVISLLLAVMMILNMFSSVALATDNSPKAPEESGAWVELQAKEIDGQLAFEVPETNVRQTFFRSAGQTRADQVTYYISIAWDAMPFDFPPDTVINVATYTPEEGLINNVDQITDLTPESGEKAYSYPAGKIYFFSLPNDLRTDVRVYFKDSGEGTGAQIKFEFSGAGNTAVLTEWFDNSSTTRPDNISAKYKAIGKTAEFDIKPKQEVIVLRDGGSYSIKNLNLDEAYERRDQELLSTDNVKVGEDATYAYFKSYIEAEGVTSGKVGTSPNEYFYNITGDGKVGFKYTFREILKVKFNSGEGKLTADGEVGAETDAQEIGYGEKFTENESGRTVKEPSVVAPTGKKFVGWSETKGGSVINKEEYAFTQPVTTLYAIYDKDDSQFVEVRVVPDGVNEGEDEKTTVKAENNPFEVPVNSKWVDGDTPENSVKGKTEPYATLKDEYKDDYAIYAWEYESGEENWTIIPDEFVFEVNQTVRPIVKKIIVDVDPEDGAYVKVTFKSDDDEATQNGGYFKVGEENKEVINKWVLKNQPRSVLAQPKPVANTGFKFNAWDKPYGTGPFTEDETYTATWTKLDDIIVDPTPDTDDDKPEGYVTVRFLPGTNGTLTGDVKYYVNPEAGKTMADITEPTIKANTGYKVADQKWDPALDTATAIDKDLTYTAQYDKMKDIIPVLPVDPEQPFNPEDNDDSNNDHKTPEGYVRVIYNAAAGTFGKYEGTQVDVKKIAFDVIETLTWETVKTTVPAESKIVPEKGYSFTGWEPTIPADGVVAKDGDKSFVAQYKQTIIEGDDPSTPIPDGYVRVAFWADKENKGNERGTLDSTLEGSTKKGVKYLHYDVLDGTTFSKVPVPTQKAKAGYKLKYAPANWNPELFENAKVLSETDNSEKLYTFDSAYRKVGDVIPYIPTDPEKPTDPEDPIIPKVDEEGNVINKDDYFIIGFNTDGNGKLIYPEDGSKQDAISYLVKKQIEGKPTEWKDIKDIVPKTEANPTYVFEKWDPAIPGGDEKVVDQSVYTAHFISATGGADTDPTPVDPIPSTPDDEDPDTKPDKKKPEIEVIFGEDRIGTAIEVSKRKFGEADTVIIARHDVFADALVAGPLAYALDAPILLTRPTELMPEVIAEIERLGAKHIIIVGGLASIDENVEKALRAIDEDLERLEGPTRYETSVKVADRLKEANGGRTTAVIATGVTYPDALTVGPFAAVEGMPILLVKPQEIPEMVGEAFDRLGIQEIYIAGGEASVGEELESQMPRLITRFSGQDRYATAVEIAKATRPNAKHIYIASGEVFPDALVAGPAAAKENAPILLSRRNVVPEILKDYIDRLSLDKITIVGGENTITRGSIESLFD